MTKIFLSLIILISSLSAQAEPVMVVKGVVISFDQKVIILKNGQAILKVPRSSYPDLKKVQIGRTKIEVRLSPEQAIALNPNFPKGSK